MPTPARKAHTRKGTARTGIRRARLDPRAGKLAATQAAYQEARVQQAATAEVLQALAGSRGDPEPVFRAIVQHAHRLCDGVFSILYRFDAKTLTILADSQATARAKKVLRSMYPAPARRDHIVGRTVLTGRAMATPDITVDSRFAANKNAHHRAVRFHAALVVPLLRGREVIGAIATGRMEAKAFSRAEVGLLQTFASQAVIAIENARLFNETKEALEQQTAASEVLKTISRSTFDLDAVLRVLIENATRLAGATEGFIFRFDGKFARLAYSHNASPAYAALMEANPIAPGRGTLVGRTLLTRRAVHIPDALADNEYVWHQAQKLGRFRSMLGVPMMREGNLIGVIAMWSHAVKPFSQKQIELVSTFADQAVIAIENVRLFNETKEALDRQTATAEILRVISASPGEVQPVLEAVAERAAALWEGSDASIHLVEGQRLKLMAHSGPIPDGLIGSTMPIEPGFASGRAVLEARQVNVADALQAAEFPGVVERARVHGVRSMLVTPLMREGQAIGSIVVRRTRVQPFNEREAELVKTFADQAVIAIENARLFNETKEGLEQQTATSNILAVISRSQTDVQPVFETVAANAARLCDGNACVVTRFDGHLVHLAAVTHTAPQALEAIRGAFPSPLSGRGANSRAIQERQIVHIPDVQHDPGYVPGGLSDIVSARSIVAVPLMVGDTAVGAIGVSRPEPRPFTDQQIALLKTFADQAAIAIENTRMFNETKEALEQQKASADVLRIVSQSVSDAQPVFQGILEAARRMFEDFDATVWMVRGSELTVAARGGRTLTPRLTGSVAIKPGGAHAQVILERKTVRLDDVARADSISEDSRRGLLERDRRALLMVPLLRQGEVIGAISVSRTRPYPFSDKQVALMQTFADQAVIAIENTRLFNQTKEALEQQTAIADVLRVIGASPTNLQPVFEAILRSAVNLCGAEIAAVFPYDGNNVHLGTTYNWTQDATDYFAQVYPSPPNPALMSGRAILGKTVVKLADAAADPHYDPTSAITGKWRRMLGVPILREGKPLGAMVVCWREPGDTPQRQVDLLRAFADQAAIAIENARLFNETKEALERQTATGEILSSISASIADATPVFNAIAGNLRRLFRTEFAAVQLLHDGQVDIVALDGASERFRRVADEYPRPLGDDFTSGRAMLQKRVVAVCPINDPAAPATTRSQASKYGGYESIIAAPMMRDDRVVGAIVTAQREAVPFDDKQVALLKSFADQAVIAIENARLFNETTEALERQTATADILRVIASTPSDTQPVFSAIVDATNRLIAGKRGGILLRDGDHFVALAFNFEGFEKIPEGVRRVPLDRERNFPSRAILDGEIVHIPDWQAEGIPEFEKQVAEYYGVRSGLIVPLMRKGAGIGALAVARETAGPYLEKEIALLRSFADQAVIAIENVRLFNETKEALEQQTATSEILKVISSSTTDVQPVFETIARNARQLLGGSSAGLMLVEDDKADLVALAAAPGAEEYASARKAYPMSLDTLASERRQFFDVLESARPASITDIELEHAEKQELLAFARSAGIRSNVVVPMLRDGKPSGLIVVNRREPHSPTPEEIQLLETFASQAVIAIENVRLFNETKEALERQTATAEILKVISSSPTDVQPVFDAIVKSAARLFRSHLSGIHMLESGGINLRATAKLDPSGELSTERSPKFQEHAGRTYPLPFDPAHNMTSQTIAEGRILEVLDTEAPGVLPAVRAMGRAGGFRSLTQVPLMRDGGGIGTITVNHREPGFRLNDKQRDLVRTFADQAVIAIENVRLFNETKESLEQQTAISEVLRVISSSPADVQPVFAAVAERAARICGADDARLFLLEGDVLRYAAGRGDLEIRQPTVPVAGSISGRAVTTRQPVHVDVSQAGDEFPFARDMYRTFGHRMILVSPLLREGRVLGVINLRRKENQPFSEKQKALLQTFADQAAIAIENVRLFNETKEALERQTATSDVLRIISTSPGDVEPVLQSIAERASVLCQAKIGFVARYDGKLLHMAAFHGAEQDALETMRRLYPMDPATGGSVAARVVRGRETVEVHDVLADGEYTHKIAAETAGFRSVLGVPLLREGQIVGAIIVVREQAGAFPTNHVELLKTFADQAAIAIENARLFNDTKEALEQQKASAEVLAVISNSIADATPVFERILQSCERLFGSTVAAITMLGEDGRLHLRAYHGPGYEEFVSAIFPLPMDRNAANALCLMERRIVHIPDSEAPGVPDAARRGHRLTRSRASIFAPMMWQEEAIGSIFISKAQAGPFSDKEVSLLKTFADQAVIAIQNARLFQQIQEKSHQLEEASKHKSQFLASMSHELRTPLNAILGFNEMILGGIYGDVPGDMTEPLKDMATSGKHLLRLINNVLDLAKIEAGRMELALGDYSVQDTVAGVHATLRPLAAEKGLEFIVDVPSDVPLAHGDGGRITQCLMNLAGNSLKFTKQGRVQIAVAQENGLLRYSVTDTGIGIPPDKIGSLFTEFKQTDATIASEFGGTGLGLSISKKFIEMHGGRIWVESEPGKGSAFRFEVPLRVAGVRS